MGEQGATTNNDAAAQSVAASRRRFSRLALDIPVEIYEARDHHEIGEPIPGVVKDIGRGGVCLRSRRAILAEQKLFVRMPLASGQWKLLFGEVRHLRYADSGMHEMGVQFLPIPSERSYQRWIEELSRRFGGGDM